VIAGLKLTSLSTLSCSRF